MDPPIIPGVAQPNDKDTTTGDDQDYEPDEDELDEDELDEDKPDYYNPGNCNPGPTYEGNKGSALAYRASAVADSATQAAATASVEAGLHCNGVQSFSVMNLWGQSALELKDKLMTMSEERSGGSRNFWASDGVS